MKNNGCCFSGHRKIPIIIESELKERLENGINYLFERGITTFYAGGALGFDTLAAEAVIRCRKVISDIQLVIVVPCKDQAKFWRLEDSQKYEKILMSADQVICLSDHYFNGCMQQRNRLMVDNSCACICYLTTLSSGTAYTVRYAQTQGVRIYNLANKKSKHA